MNICFFTYSYKPDSVDNLPNIFAEGTRKQSYGDIIEVLDCTDINYAKIQEKIKNIDLAVISGTWGSVHHSRTSDSPIGHMNKINQTVKYLTKTMNKTLLVFESPTLSRSRSSVQTLKNFHPRYYRASLDHWVYGLGEFFTKDYDYHRFEQFCKANRLLKTKTESLWASRSLDAPVLILPEKNSAPTLHGIDPSAWADMVVHTLRESTRRPIWIKPSPHHLENIDYTKYEHMGVTLLNKETNLNELLKEVWATVILDSTACFESLWQGVPVFCYPGSFAGELGNTDITKIDAPVRVPLIPWWQKMAYTEFTQQEIQRGTIWSYIRPQILDSITRKNK